MIGDGIFDITPPTWTRDAVCAQVDPELFFPEKGGHNGSIAIRICQQCPARLACLEYALEAEETTAGRYGIFGGTTPMQRRRIAQQRKRAAS